MKDLLVSCPEGIKTKSDGPNVNRIHFEKTLEISLE